MHGGGDASRVPGFSEAEQRPLPPVEDVEQGAVEILSSAVFDNHSGAIVSLVVTDIYTCTPGRRPVAV